MKIIITLLVSVFLLNNTVKAQKLYRASDWEIIFSLSNLSENGNNIPSGMRFTAFFHTQQTLNYDINNTFGLYTGLGIRNIGIMPSADSIYFHKSNKYYYKTSPENTFTKAKIRTYTIGLPIALKFGNFKNGLYFYVGGEIEYSFHYKEKIWLENTKDFNIEKDGKNKYTKWFGNEVTQFIPSVFAGVKLPRDITVNFKWYLQNFLNTNHTVYSNNKTIRPYKNYKSQLFYVSIGFIFERKTPKPIDKNSPLPAIPTIDM